MRQIAQVYRWKMNSAIRKKVLARHVDSAELLESAESLPV
jgi:hypothetical protein